ncbi:MAG: F0F1 ATP synthase subunit B [Nitrospirota bacterium]
MNPSIVCRTSSIIFLILLFVVEVSAFAAGEVHEVSLKDWVWRIINFGILVFILVKFLGKPVKDFFKKRSEGIEKSLKEAEEAKTLALKAFQQIEEKIKVKDKEVEEILAASRRAGEKERDNLIELGDKLKQRILEQARINIEFELRRAREAIKAEAIEIAMELAEKRIKDKLTEEEQRRLFEESLNKIEAKN